MKNLKIKALTLGVISTLIVSSTPVFAATSTSTSNTKSTISAHPTSSTIKPSYNWISAQTEASGVNFRTGPGTNYGIICVIYDKGTPIYMDLDYRETNGFVRVTYNGKIGYMYASYVGITTLP